MIPTQKMAIHNHDVQFSQLKFSPIILNDMPVKTKEEREALNTLIMSTYDSADTLDAVPTCACKDNPISFGYNVGVLCPRCNTRVEAPAEIEIESNVWFRAPEGITGLVNPMLWMILSNVLTSGNFNALHWFCDPRMSMPPETNRGATTIVNRFIKTGIPRGLNSFIANFDALMETIARPLKPSERIHLITFMMTYRDSFFPKHLPFPSKIAFVMENTATGTYADVIMREAIDAVRTITSLDTTVLGDHKRLESKIAGVINSLSQYYSEMFGKPLGDKEGWLRDTVFGVPGSPHSFRTVIVSNHGIHDYEEMYIPYPEAVVLFKIHLLNKLHNRGFSHRSAWRYLTAHTQNRDPLVLELLEEIFAEGQLGQRGIHTLFIRYPTLRRGSIQCFRIVGLSSEGSTLSVLAVREPNADLIN